MAIAFSYTESTNTVVLTGGTSGTPATFADFVTADRAGTAALLAAIAGASNNTLTYQIRPVEDLAIVVDCVVASKTTEADYIFITGTDAWGGAQTESIDVSAGNGTYTTTLRFQTITNLDCSDNAAGGGTVWADGTIAINQGRWGVIWDCGNSCQFQVDCALFDIGNNSTSTYFASELESLYFAGSGGQVRIRTQGHLRLGKESGGWGVDGSWWNMGPTSTCYLLDWLDPCELDMYASWLHLRDTGGYVLFRIDGTLKVKNSIFSSAYDGGITNEFFFNNMRVAATVEYEDVYTYKAKIGSYIANPPDVFKNFKVHEAGIGAYSNAAGSKLTNVRFTNLIDNAWHINTAANGSTLELIDPIDFPASPTIVNNQADNWVQETYTCNINVVDHRGTALAGVVVDCEETGGTAVWTAGTISTDASGDIAEQEIPYKRWSGTSEALTDYSPHKFTIYKPGYETHVLENITVDAPIVWHLELQPMRARIYGRSHRIDVKQFI